MLLGAVAIGLVHIGLQSFTLKGAMGNRWSYGPRDEPAQMTPLAGRMERASRNFFESFPLFATVILIATFTHTSNSLTLYGAHMYLWGRLAYIPAYWTGWPMIRTFFWQVATLGIVVVGAGLAMEAGV